MILWVEWLYLWIFSLGVSFILLKDATVGVIWRVNIQNDPLTWLNVDAGYQLESFMKLSKNPYIAASFDLSF